MPIALQRGIDQMEAELREDPYTHHDQHAIEQGVSLVYHQLFKMLVSALSIIFPWSRLKMSCMSQFVCAKESRQMKWLTTYLRITRTCVYFLCPHHPSSSPLSSGQKCRLF